MEKRWPIEIDGFSWFTYYFNGGSFHGELLVITRGYMPLTSMKCNFCWWMLVSNAPPRWKLQRFHVIHVPSQEMGWSSSTDKHVHMAYDYMCMYTCIVLYRNLYSKCAHLESGWAHQPPPALRSSPCQMAWWSRWGLFRNRTDGWSLQSLWRLSDMLQSRLSRIS